MTHQKITAAIGVVLISGLIASHGAQAQVNKRDKVRADVHRSANPDERRPQSEQPRGTPRIQWHKLWHNSNAMKIEVPGVDESCRASARASLETTDMGVVNTGTDTQRLSCRMSLGEQGAAYQVSVLTDHGASEAFQCSAGPVRASRRHAQQTARFTELEESAGTDRDEWEFIASRRLTTVAVRCRIPAGGVVREITLTDCRVDTCATGGE